MASAFGHAFSAIALGTTFSKSLANWKFWALGIICSILSDADVITFSLGIPYNSFWGHRGFSHSFIFAVIISILFSYLFYLKNTSLKNRLALITSFFLCTASHGILDAMTTGGVGVAFFSPWDNSRYFLPWRPIQVSPIGLDTFFGERGLRVVLSELVWIGTPGLIYMMIVKYIRRTTLSKK